MSRGFYGLKWVWYVDPLTIKALQTPFLTQRPTTSPPMQTDRHTDMSVEAAKCEWEVGGVNGTYKGSELDGKPHGKGKFTYSSGVVHEGTWKYGVYHGAFEQTHPSGAVLKGVCVDGMQHGVFTATYPNGGTAVYDARAWETYVDWKLEREAADCGGTGELQLSRPTCACSRSWSPALLGTRPLSPRDTNTSFSSSLQSEAVKRPGVVQEAMKPKRTKVMVRVRLGYGKLGDPCAVGPGEDGALALDLGQPLEVYWPKDGKWYAGKVVGYDVERSDQDGDSGMHHRVLYDDKDLKWHNLNKRKYRVVGCSGGGGAT